MGLKERLRQLLQGFIQDKLFRRILRNSSFLFASSVIAAVLSLVTANMLGVEGFGTLGILTGFVSGVNRLFSFRMGDVVVKYMGEALARHETERAGAVVKAALLAEAITSIAAFVCLALISPFAATYVAKDPSTTPLFLLFGISILANLTTETSTGVLQVTNHFRSQALINLLQSVLVAAMIIYAFFNNGGLLLVLWAYLIGKIITGLGPILLAFYWLPRAVDARWYKSSMTLLPPRRELVKFAVSTNFSATITLLARDSEVTWVGYFFDKTAAGYFKTALAIINLIVMPITPFISTSYPEITRAYASRAWSRLRSLLQRVTLVAAGWTGAVVVGLLLFGQPVLFQYWNIFGHRMHLYSPEFLPSFPVLMILLVGFGTANILFWNRPLLLAQGFAGYPLKVSFWAMLAKIGLAFVLLPWAGYWAEAALLSGFFVVTVGLNVWQGLRQIDRAEAVAILQQETA